MKLASGGHLDDLDTTSFLAQGVAYEEGGDLRDSLLKMLLVEAKSHPFAVERADELPRWVESGSYTGALVGDYPVRGGGDDATPPRRQPAAASRAGSTRRSGGR